MNTQAEVAIQKQKHPEYYCPTPRCLWRVLVCHPMTREMVPAPNCVDGYCPRHKAAGQHKQEPEPKSTVIEWIRNGYTFPGMPVPTPRPPEPKPTPGPITVPPSPDNPPKKPGEKGGL